MAAKPELSAAPGVQNVVVYVSNDNFTQAYAVSQHNDHAALQNNSYTNSQHTMAPMVGPPKSFIEKQPIAKPPDYPAEAQIVNGGSVHPQGGYFTGVISQNGFNQPVINNIHYSNGAINQVKSFGSDVLSCERQGPGRPELKECERDTFVDSGYITVMGAECPSQSVRCDSVRSEAAESSCSSLSSADEGLVLVQNPPSEMVVYDSSVSVRPGGVVLTVGPSAVPQHQSTHVVGPAPVHQQTFVTIPYGWKRLLNNGSVIYISPSNTVLSNPEQAKEYLLSSGTCKCGLECHFKYDSVFNFDPKIIGKPWTLSPDTNPGDLTKLCNHKRKIIEMASLDCKPPDPNIKLRKDYNVKRKKRKMGIPYGNGVSVSHILAQREKLALNQHHQFSKDQMQVQQQIWQQPQLASNRLQGFPDSPQNPHLIRYPVHSDPHGAINNEDMVNQQQVPQNISHQMQPQPNQPQQISQIPNSNPNMHIQGHHMVGPNGQIISVQGANQLPPNMHQNIVNNSVMNPNGGVVLQSQNIPQHLNQQHRIFVNGQPTEPSGPGRPNVQVIPVSLANQQMHQQQQRLQDMPQQRIPQQFYPNQSPGPYPQMQQFDASKAPRPFMTSMNNQMMNGFRPHLNQHNQMSQGHMMMNQQQKMHWPHRPPHPQQNQMVAQNQQIPPGSNVYERVPPLHQHTPQPPQNMWHEDLKRKKAKMGKIMTNHHFNMMECQSAIGPCPNIDVRQIPHENSRPVIVNQLQQSSQSAPSPSFMDDPSGYLAQQTALLNNTINRQTGVNSCPGYSYNSPATSTQQSHNPNMLSTPNTQANEVPLPSNVISQMKPIQNVTNRHNQNINLMKTQHMSQNITTSQHYNQMVPQGIADSSAISSEQHQQVPSMPCQCCIADSMGSKETLKVMHSRPNSQPGTPSSSGCMEDPVTSSTFCEKLTNHNQGSPDNRPIQGGTVSTSNVSPMDGVQSGPPTPNPQTPNSHLSNSANSTPNPHNSPQRQQENTVPFIVYSSNNREGYNIGQCVRSSSADTTPRSYGVVTTMASGRTVGSNTITSVLAGRANTATVSINSPSSINNSSPPSSNSSNSNGQPAVTNVSKSPLEMVQSVVSSIQVPHSQQPLAHSNAQISPPHVVKHSPTNLPPGHILVSSGGQLIMASTGNCQPNVMPPPPPKIVTNQGTAMPPISVSPMVTNVTAAVTQMIPAVAQQVLGQQTVLVNALPTPFVLQPGMTMTMDGMTVGQNMQIPQLVTGNVIQQQIQIDNSDPRRVPALLSPDNKKKGKKRKMSQTVANMLHIAAQQNPGVVMSQQGFPQQIQMAHSPQGITTTPVMQALTIVPSKTGGTAQIVMNGQAVANANIGTQQIITNSQPAQQINLLQPVNLINGATGVVQNFPTIQQFIVPNLGGMVMNADGTATLLQDTSNIGMQLQLQNVNGQNVLTPVQNSGVFNGGQSILAAGPAGMVIRAPTTSQGKIIQQQQHSPGAQFLSPNGGQFVVNSAQFGGQLSPLVASVSPSQQVTFSAAGQQIRPSNQTQQDFIQCGQVGQTLMVPCSPSASTSNQQNTTFVQQNTTIVQQQTTMVSNNQQLQNFSQNNPQSARTTTLNVDQNFVISSNDNKQVQAILVQRDNGQISPSDRQSVSTQTAVNQNSQAVTTNTFCQTSTISAGSPPDTTTHSPMATGGQSPPTADTTTHSGSTDDGLSPAPSNCSTGFGEVNIQGRQTCTMAMVHCISSSEPDSADLHLHSSEQDWSRGQSQPKTEIGDITSVHMQYNKKSVTPTHIAYAESSTMVSGLHMIEHMKQEPIVSSRNYEKIVQKRKSSDNLLVIEASHIHTSLYDDEATQNDDSKRANNLVVGDLVWGPFKGCSSWPGKIIQACEDSVLIKWFGTKTIKRVKVDCLQTLSEGLDVHHEAQKKLKTSRKLSKQLENAIQEAMSELDKKSKSIETEDSTVERTDQ